MVKCPRCATDISIFAKEWDYGIFHVRNYECKECDKSFKAYFREGKLSHTIPKRK